MKVLMDTDCLIKLTKSMLKELVCGNFSVIIPQIVKEEVVDNAKEHPDAAIIKRNIETGLLTINKMRSSAQKGEDAVFAIFHHGKFDAVCSDDKSFIKRLRLFDIPYITPSVFIAILLKKGKLTIKEANKKLDSLSPFVSEDEYNAVKLVLENWRTQ
jgi:rRNA-processing protein FCF1